MDTKRVVAILAIAAAAGSMGLRAQAIGEFEQQADVGTVAHAGSAAYDTATKAYSITGSGENIWDRTDAFHMIWKKGEGDLAMSADISFPTATGNPHKKAVLMIRQSLDADSAYVDAAVHASGLVSLQSRGEKGGETTEVGVDGEGIARVRIEKRGDFFYLFLARNGQPMHFAGGSLRLKLTEPFYVGLGVSAHDREASETAVFANVDLGKPARGKEQWYSTLETISVSSTARRVVNVFEWEVGDATWTPDGQTLIFKRGRKTPRQIPAAGGATAAASFTPMETGAETAKGDGKRKSPDGRSAVWIGTAAERKPAATELKIESGGGEKVLANLMGTKESLSGAPWSPDGRRLVFVSYQRLPKEAGAGKKARR